MNNIIFVRINGCISSTSKEELRNKIKNELEEGLLIVDDMIKDVTVSTIHGDVGLDFNENEETEFNKVGYDEKESI